MHRGNRRAKSRRRAGAKQMLFPTEESTTQSTPEVALPMVALRTAAVAVVVWLCQFEGADCQSAVPTVSSLHFVCFTTSEHKAFAHATAVRLQLSYPAATTRVVEHDGTLESWPLPLSSRKLSSSTMTLHHTQLWLWRAAWVQRLLQDTRDGTVLVLVDTAKLSDVALMPVEFSWLHTFQHDKTKQLALMRDGSRSRNFAGEGTAEMFRAFSMENHWRTATVQPQFSLTVLGVRASAWSRQLISCWLELMVAHPSICLSSSAVDNNKSFDKVAACELETFSSTVNAIAAASDVLPFKDVVSPQQDIQEDQPAHTTFKFTPLGNSESGRSVAVSG